MASLNGGIVGKVNDPGDVTQDAVVTTFNSSGTLTTAALTSEVEHILHPLLQLLLTI